MQDLVTPKATEICWSFKGGQAEIERGRLTDGDGAQDLRTQLWQGSASKQLRVSTTIRKGRRNLIIRAQSEFGTGLHASTSALLRLLVNINCGRRSHRVLDAGSGSGILGITSALLGARHVEYLDARPSAIKASASNAWRNAKGHRRYFTIRKLSGQAFTGHFDLILSNNIASHQRKIVRSLQGVFLSRSLLILGGIEHSRARDMKSFCAQFGLRIINESRTTDWTVLVIAKRRDSLVMQRRTLRFTDKSVHSKVLNRK